MHYIMNNKTGAFVSALLHSIKYGKACRFVTDGNVVLKNMKNVYGIDMDDFSVLDAGPRRTAHCTRMIQAAAFVRANPGCAILPVAEAVGPHGSRNHGYRTVHRAIKAGLIRAEVVGGRYSLYAA